MQVLRPHNQLGSPLTPAHLLPSPSPPQLRPVPFAQQAQQALEVGEHEEALALAALMPSEKVRRRLRANDAGHACTPESPC